MSDNVFVNASRTEIVDEASPGKKWQMKRKEAQRLGLLPEGDAKPQVRRNAREDTTRSVTTSTPREDTERTFSTSGPASTPKKAAKK